MKRFRVPKIQRWAAAGMLLMFLQKLNAGDTAPTPSQKDHEQHKANILSFDGGGSRGIMEVAILDDVFRLVTILKKNPSSLKYLIENEQILLDQNKRKMLVDDLSNVKEPIHPTEVFDMIVGTSTGGLIAFGLVGGNIDINGKRIPMSLKECIEMYLHNTEKIFKQSWHQWFLSFLSWVSGILVYPYSLENLERVLFDQFGNSSLRDFRYSETVAGAIARKIGEKEDLVLFDTKCDAHKFYMTRQVLMATADAPIYFETPVKIGDHEYVDGGVGGNCPLAQAIPRAQEIFGDVKFVLSVAPPPFPEIRSYFQQINWIKYFVDQLTDGYAVYRDAKRRHTCVSYQRLTPRGESLKVFTLDEYDARKMLNAIEKEKLTNELFLVDVIATAAFVYNAYVSKSGDNTEASAKVGAELARLAGKIYAAAHEQGIVEDSFRMSLNLLSKITEDNINKSIAETEGELSTYLIRQGKYFEASKHANISLQNWNAFHDNKDHESVSYALLAYGKSLHLIGQYKVAYKNYELALEMQKRIYGENASNACVASILAHMGWFCRENGKLDKAESLLTKVLRIQRQLHRGHEHIDVARAYDSLGLCFISQRKFRKGEEYLVNSLKIKQRLFGNKNHPAIAESYNNLGWCLLRKQKHKDAQSYLQKALRMKKSLFGEDDHKSTALTLDNIAKSLVYQGQHNNALERAQQALNMKINLFGDVEHPKIAKTLHTIGLCLVKGKDFLEANKYLTKAVKMIEDVFESKDHPVLAIFLTTLGDSLVGIGNYSDANVYFKRALKIIDREYGCDFYPDVQDILRKLADMSEKLGHCEDKQSYKKRLEIVGKQWRNLFKKRRQALFDEEICSRTNSTRPLFLGFEFNDDDILPEASTSGPATHGEL